MNYSYTLRTTVLLIIQIFQVISTNELSGLFPELLFLRYFNYLLISIILSKIIICRIVTFQYYFIQFKYKLIYLINILIKVNKLIRTNLCKRENRKEKRRVKMHFFLKHLIYNLFISVRFPITKITDKTRLMQVLIRLMQDLIRLD